MRGGRMRERVDIQVIALTPDGAGGNTKGWSAIAQDVACEVLPLNGGEAFSQGVARNTQFYRVTMRYREDVTPRHRLWWRGKALNIRTCADPDNKRASLVLTVESGAPEPA